MAVALDINIIEKYIKELEDINSNDVKFSCFLQSKSYLKNLKVPYYSENILSSIIYNQIKKIIKKTHIFNNIVFAS